jgi:hypothetical protein
LLLLQLLLLLLMTHEGLHVCVLLTSGCDALSRLVLVTALMAAQPWKALQGGRQHTPLLLLCLLMLRVV